MKAVLAAIISLLVYFLIPFFYFHVAIIVLTLIFSMITTYCVYLIRHYLAEVDLVEAETLQVRLGQDVEVEGFLRQYFLYLIAGIVSFLVFQQIILLLYLGISLALLVDDVVNYIGNTYNSDIQMILKEMDDNE